MGARNNVPLRAPVRGLSQSMGGINVGRLPSAPAMTQSSSSVQAQSNAGPAVVQTLADHHHHHWAPQHISSSQQHISSSPQHISSSQQHISTSQQHISTSQAASMSHLGHSMQHGSSLMPGMAPAPLRQNAHMGMAYRR